MKMGKVVSGNINAPVTSFIALDAKCLEYCLSLIFSTIPGNIYGQHSKHPTVQEKLN